MLDDDATRTTGEISLSGDSATTTADVVEPADRVEGSEGILADKPTDLLDNSPTVSRPPVVLERPGPLAAIADISLTRAGPQLVAAGLAAMVLAAGAFAIFQLSNGDTPDPGELSTVIAENGEPDVAPSGPSSSPDNGDDQEDGFDRSSGPNVESAGSATPTSGQASTLTTLDSTATTETTPTTPVPTSETTETTATTDTTVPTSETTETTETTVVTLPEQLIVAPAAGAVNGWAAPIRLQAAPVPDTVAYCWTFSGVEQVERCSQAPTLDLRASELGLSPGPVTVLAQARTGSSAVLLEQAITVNFRILDYVNEPTAGQRVRNRQPLVLQSDSVPTADRYCWTINGPDGSSGEICGNRSLVIAPGSDLRDQLGEGDATVIAQAYRGEQLVGRHAVPITLG